MRTRIRDAVPFMLPLPAEMRSLAGLRLFLDHGDGSTGARLEEWCRGGTYGWAFDNEEDLIRLDAGVVGIDNTAILVDEMKRVRLPAASYQLHRIGQKIGQGQRGAVLVDEAANYLPDERFAAGFDRFSRDLRKGNGLFAMVVHHPGDLTRHPVGKTLLINCPLKALFPNPGADMRVYRDDVNCSPGEIEAVLERMITMGPGTVLFKRPDGSFIARAPLGAHPAHLAVLSSNFKRRALWHRISRELGTTEADRIWPVYLQRHEEANA